MSLQLRKALEDLLYVNDVDLCIWGHYHSYERTCKVYNAQCVDDGPVHMVFIHHKYIVLIF